MTNNKWLGKITHASFGYGGYQDCMFGLSLTFEGRGCGVSAFIGFWGWDTERHERAAWTEEGRDAEILKACKILQKTLKEAGKRHVEQLVGVPVEVTCGWGETLDPVDGWRILTEVL